jgi:nucleoside-diphosphate-sugar epimerase
MRRLTPSTWIQSEARSLLFLGFLERQILQLQWINGTPVEVPHPKTVTRIFPAFMIRGKAMRILVSGASGFIGSGLVSALAEKGHEVFALMRPGASAAHLKNVPFTRITGDILDSDSLKRACQNMEAVFHLAGLTAARTRQEYFKFNAEGTKNLALAAAHSGSVTRFIYVSSLAASGPSVGLAPKLENDPDYPVSMYGESKLRGELYLDELKNQLPFIVIRPPMVYGPRDRNVYLFFKSIQKNWMPVLPSRTPTGHKYYSAIHVDDLIQVLINSLSADPAIFQKGERFNVSDGQIYTYERIMNLISDELKVKPIRFKVPDAVVSLLASGGTLAGKILNRSLPLNRDKLNELISDYWICSSQKAFDQLTFKPKYTLETGVPQTVAWYKVNGWL